MAVITIREQVQTPAFLRRGDLVRVARQTETGFNATLIIDGNNYNITVSDPFEPKEEQELEWYFEDWLRYPMLDNVKANRAKESVKKYGEELFKQVFQKDINAYRKYNQLRGNLSRVQIEIESISPEFQAIHWEALQDPDLPRPLAVDSVLIRKNVKPAIIEANVNESPTVNLLVVTARPGADEDVGYRTISRPLVEAIRNAQLRVNIELLRPGTYEALAKHLESKGSGYYHIVHFDVHGSLQTYETYQERIELERYPLSRYGREEIKPYEGFKAFLALEANQKGEADPVEATELANLLTSKGIPVCILNACQSGKQLNPSKEEDNRETSLASRLMNAGMQMVVAMSYSVTVTAAKIIMEQIYKYLFDKQDLNNAIRLGRTELYNRKGRRAYYNIEIELEDWLLPVTYCNGKVDFNLREFTPEEEEKYWLSLDSEYKFTGSANQVMIFVLSCLIQRRLYQLALLLLQPTYEFIGRDIDILLIEKALLKHNILLLQGMGGAGKTTLLNYLREWWQVTNFAEDIFYFGYDKKAWTLQQILFAISEQVHSDSEHSDFQSKNLITQWQKLALKLRIESYILILDNLESVTGQPLAIQNTLDESAREEIRKFLASLVGGKTKVVLGSRIGEEWLQNSTFRDNNYQLKGLDTQARTDLAESILQKIDSSKSLDEIKTDQYFERLMKLLAGYPLAMKVLLANLKQQSPEEILEQLEKAEINPGGEDKTNNIVKCIEYSYRNLSASAQKLLLLLAPFRGIINTVGIPNYVEKFKKLTPFQDYDLEQLESAVTEAVSWGLLSPIDKYNSHLLTIQPVLPYFLQTKLKKVDEETRAALQEGFKNHYQLLAGSYNHFMQSKEHQERRMGIAFVRLEYENLYQGLQICLKQKKEAEPIWFCLFYYLELMKSKNEQLQLTKALYDKLSIYNLEDSYEGWETDIVSISTNLGTCYLESQDYQKAKPIYEKVLVLIPKFKNIENSEKQSYLAIAYHQLGRLNEELKQFKTARKYYQQALDIKIESDDRYSQAMTYHHLGYVAQQLRQFQKAREYYQKALDIFDKDGDRYKQAATYHHLGYLEQELRQYKQAQEYYQQALNIDGESGDHYAQATTYYQLGSLAGELREYSQAQEYYQKALDIYMAYGDRYKQAGIYGHLGIIAQALRQYKQAQEYYQKALEIYKEYGDRYGQASAYNPLGSIAQKLREYPQAQEYYQKALEIYKEYGYQQGQATTYNELGYLAQKLREYSQAQEYYQKALEIYKEYGDRYEQAGTYYQLGSLTQELRQYPQANHYYQQALDLYMEYEDHSSQANTYHQLGIVAQELRQYKQAQDYYQQSLEIKIAHGDRKEQAETFHQLGMVAQELRQYKQAQDYYQKALKIDIEYGNHSSQASVYHQLGILAQKLRQYQQANDYYQQALEIKIEDDDHNSQAGTYYQLGKLAWELRQYQQAQDYYQQALDIDIKYGNRYEQAGTYHQLGIVAQELRQYQQAQDYYQQALEIYIEYGDRYSQASTYQVLGVVALALRQYPQAKDYYQQALEIYIECGDRYLQAYSKMQLGLLAEELSKFEEAKSYYFQALEIFVEFEDQQNGGLTSLTISSLAILYQKTQDNNLLTEFAAMFNSTEAEVRELFEGFKP